MDACAKLRLLYDLHGGHTSRNRDFARFRHPEARRVWAGYRIIRSLLRDLRIPDTRGAVRTADREGAVLVAVERPGLRYRRVVLLSPWEASFFFEQMGPAAEALLAAGRGPGLHRLHP